MIDRGDRPTAEDTRVEFDVFALNVFDDHNLHFGEKVQRELANCITKIDKMSARVLKLRS